MVLKGALTILKSQPWVPYAAGFGGIVTTAALFLVLSRPDRFFDEHMRVAFAGNYYLSINDIPRVLSNLNEGQIDEQSCLAPKGSIASILSTGNGMLNVWSVDTALNDRGTNYDFGVCTVEQLLFGKDDTLDADNTNYAYEDDGTNPCFNSANYLKHLNKTVLANFTSYDYVVLSDQAKRMADDKYRPPSIVALYEEWIPMLEVSETIPVIVAPHAFYSDLVNMTGLENYSEFASLIHQGATEYQAVLIENGQSEAPIVPVDMAFLAIYEEDEDMFSLLTSSDGVHSSLYGSYLIACCLYATVAGYMPPKDTWSDVQGLFANARYIAESSYGYPGPEDAQYLWEVAKRVTLDGYVPSTFIEYEPKEWDMQDLSRLYSADDDDLTRDCYY
eukprot:CAMPEP_0194030708 /NCGR_PEP_ID=MMETSP0009_2-20130614/4078_1 /TAXON_ID=210454 /ORGANISM="Grammatophora oceanica, Strain CCMP 410" /LENGTH=388 /DNA_ID=CAMNT_0038670693 /DNA_START=13 /DNA_END=1179 /DNA_ORIENTATION=-